MSWGLLSLIYSFTVAVLLQPLLESAFKKEFPLEPLWIATCGLLLLPGAFEFLPVPSLPLIRQGRFSESLWRWKSGSMGPLYLRHEMRRGATWVMVIFVVCLLVILPERFLPFSILLFQLPIQRALYSVHRWRSLALAAHPKGGASLFLMALLKAQVLQWLVVWASASLLGVFRGPDLWTYGLAGLSAVIASSITAFEGDSGRPWLVNFMALAAGSLAGYLTLSYPWILALVLYFSKSMIQSVEGRLKSVEHLDEDRVIS